MSVLPYVRGPVIADVGSGAGLPGLVLAIARPELQWTLLDSNRKKTLFCGQAARALRLANVTVVHCRAEEHRPEAGYQGITTRAWTARDEMLRRARASVDLVRQLPDAVEHASDTGADLGQRHGDAHVPRGRQLAGTPLELVQRQTYIEQRPAALVGDRLHLRRHAWLGLDEQKRLFLSRFAKVELERRAGVVGRGLGGRDLLRLMDVTQGHVVRPAR